MVDSKKIKVEISNRHVHLSRRHIDILFGRGYKLRFGKELSQFGEYASREKIRIVNFSNKGVRKIENVRVLGPFREKTQVEISKSDADYLRLNASLRLSGDLENSTGLILVGPRGKVRLTEGVIIAHRHLHLAPEEAEELDLKDKDIIMVKIPGRKLTILGDVVVKIGKNNRLTLHIDRDEGNACFLDGECFGEIIQTPYL
jgi:putative phosphotransacetylase